MTDTCFALVDCNNFYASCERLFRPDLRNKPIVVLSNNDGCIVARSAEAKALGISMAVPLFQAQEIIDREQIAVFSSNYALYGDISARVMSLLEQLAPATEVYSIDEAFLDLSGIGACQPLSQLATNIKQQVTDWTGIPVCIGIAPTKTLAKLANHAAKRIQNRWRC
ncbi:Y-family DNA polymerase [Aliamphritea spongicola]